MQHHIFGMKANLPVTIEKMTSDRTVPSESEHSLGNESLDSIGNNVGFILNSYCFYLDMAY